MQVVTPVPFYLFSTGYFSRMTVKIPQEFYLQDDVVAIARQLLGKTLVTRVDGKITAGTITETEAYCGATDKACHAYPNKKTARTQVMFGKGGHSYVYLCYGIHNLFNIVTNVGGYADAVLIRAVEPVAGEKYMLERKNYMAVKPALTTGPGSLSKAFGITTEHYGLPLWGDTIWLEDAPDLPAAAIHSTTRIGVDYAGEDALLPWRFYMKNSQFVSKR